MIIMKKEMEKDTRNYLEMAKRFTAVFKEHLESHVAVREGSCLMKQYPALCRPIKADDVFAGRKHHLPLVGFMCELNVNKQCEALSDIPGCELTEEENELREKLGISNSGFCHDHSGLVALAEEHPNEHDAIMELVTFWDDHSMRRHYNAALTEDVTDVLSKTTGFDTRCASGFMRQDCYSLDYDKLLQLGIPGLRAQIEKKRETADDPDFHTGLLLALDVLVNVCLHYAAQALTLAETCADEKAKVNLEEMTETLEHITEKKPETLRQAIQLFWLYNMVSDTPNYGRTDVYLGDFYCADIDSGRLTEADAHHQLCALWKIISEIRDEGGATLSNARIVVGGKGRRNEALADRFALAAMEVVLEMRVNEPNFTLRFYDGQNPALMARALDLIGEGCIHPGLYNDDEHIPMVQQWHNVTEKDAAQYLPQGCGEILIDHMGFGSPNNIFVLLSGLELVLHNGFDITTGEQRGLALGNPADFDTFDKLVEAFKQQTAAMYTAFAKRHAIEHNVEAEHGAFLYLSMLSDDCIDHGRSLFNGGVRYLGGIIETFALTNVADSLAAIRELVYEQNVMTLEKLVKILDANFEGYEKERRMMLECPKFGNDDPRVDDLHTELSNFINRTASEAGKKEGLHFFLNCNLNPGGIYYSYFTKPSADGRLNVDAMAMGNTPTAGRDRNGVTALLNSLSRHGKMHAGYAHNLKMNKSMFTPENRPKVEVLFDTYFKNGGIQLMVTVLDKNDLENALKEPEKYQNLQVRVAGWTCKFVELRPEYQREILERTLYS